MTQMADEIRTLITDLYDDSDSFLKRPHRWFGGRSPNELMATEAGQLLLLKFLRGEDHIPPTEPDRDFKPWSAASTDHLVDQAIACLEGKIEQLKALKGSGPEIATVIGRAQEVFGERGLIWLTRHNQILQATPLDLVALGRTDRILRLLGQIEHGVYA